MIQGWKEERGKICNLRPVVQEAEVGGQDKVVTPLKVGCQVFLHHHLWTKIVEFFWPEPVAFRRVYGT